ncbi:MAG: PKD domain-containing protein [Candidatus Thermoplasmatota archaeon]|nr:PKD domain-containing protein [Candidatus Thermoplasmatota archaeon]
MDYSNNKWFYKYPTGGNYWSDYHGEDKKKGSQQNEYGSDGLGDSPYYINKSENIKDSYPIFKDITPPNAVAGTDVLINQGFIYHFDSTASADDQLVHKVEWVFDYGGEHRVITEKEFDFKFDIAGFYPVNLTVFDFPGNSDTDSFNITVKDITDPIAIAQGDLTIDQGELALFNASLSSDNSGITNYTWTFKYDDEFLELYGRTTSFKFVIPGIYQVKLRVTDTADRFAETNFNVTIIDTEKPFADAGPDFEIDNGGTADLGPSLSTDNGVITNYTWSFTYEGKSIRLFGPSNSFVFDRPGHYTVELNVTDQFSNFDTDDLLVTVVDTIPPSAVINGSLFQDTGEMIRLNGLSSTDNGFITRYLWEFSDDGYLTYEGPYLNNTFQWKGKHNVTLTVFDQWNNSDMATVTIEVLDKETPKASAGDDAAIPAGTTFTFNASGSTDDGRIVSYLWIFEYNDVEKRLDGAKAQFTFDKGGTYNILLRVTDQSGKWGEDGLKVTVIDTGVLKGTVLDKDGNPLKGAKVTVRASDGKDHLGMTSMNGSFIIDVFMGEATYKITLPGYESVSGTVNIIPMQTRLLDSTETTLERAEGPPKDLLVTFIVIFVINVLLIAMAVVLLVVMKKRRSIVVEGSGEELTGELPVDGTVPEIPLQEATDEFPDMTQVLRKQTRKCLKGTMMSASRPSLGKWSLQSHFRIIINNDVPFPKTFHRGFVISLRIM